MRAREDSGRTGVPYLRASTPAESLPDGYVTVKELAINARHCDSPSQPRRAHRRVGCEPLFRKNFRY